METSGGSYSSNQQFSASFAGSRRDVTYSCGSCGYDLNLNSSSRNTSTIGSKYGKSIKKGIISFFTIDESRFNQAEEFSCVPYFIFKHSCGIFSRKTKLLCRKCGNLVGIASDLNNDSPIHLITDGSDSPSSSEFTSKRKYDIRIRSLQPSSAGFDSEISLTLSIASAILHSQFVKGGLYSV
ncbi:uncharacterized protein At4g08330, chloroplastic-like isoform X4 [Salvia hispanica]|uniref:uncharacterized protein At4g08330, chloroplastic-like isoform X4 n=2 Tax=Salvia hispanica TaxID=49212 RepID=UPI002009946D|nr:uncharacterized protein At4g08330, chloroplastic-like isoform X4 [Salvia hispanica]